MPRAAATVSGRLSMRATTAAVNGASSRAGPPTAPRSLPRIGADSSDAMPERPAATIHVTRDSRRTGMPSRSARSFESAAPRMAMPVSLLVKNHASATRTPGTTARASTWSPMKTKGCTRNVTWKGVLKVLIALRCENRVGSQISRAPRIWSRPIVATVRIRRGASKNRRITVASTSAPVPTANARPIGSAAKYGRLQPRTITMATVAASPPISAWAKLMMRVAR